MRISLAEAIHAADATARATVVWEHPLTVARVVDNIYGSWFTIEPPPPMRAVAKSYALDALTCCMWRCALAFSRDPTR